MDDQSFKKNERLRFRSQFQYVLNNGRRKRVDKFCTLFFLPNGLDQIRLGIIASKKIGKAVVRNRAKRRIREVFRRIKCQVAPAMDIVIISGKDLVLLPFSILEKKILENLQIKQ